MRDDKVRDHRRATGRVSPDRSWEQGLHQLIEVKEGCTVTAERETLASISYQQFFRRYLRLAGMTGTAREVTRELWEVYRLHTQVVPTRLPSRRRDLGTRIFATATEKWAAVVEAARGAHERAQPVLVGTWSLASSERVSALLTEQGLPHQLLNARQDAEEAQIVAQAGLPGCITVATNMAGRGTDIRLAPGVAEHGGLCVIATELGDARRIDRQLFGRCGRQGDPGSFQMVVSLEDDAIAHRCPRPLLRILARRLHSGEPLSRKATELLTWLAQHAEESRQARARRSLVSLEEYLDDFLAFAGPRD